MYIKPRQMLKQQITLVIAVLLVSAGLGAQTFYHTGSEEPVTTNHLPGLVLAGGRTDNDDAMRWMLERAGGGDVVVLRASGSDGYNNYFYTALGAEINSVTSIVITSSEQADNEAVLEALSNAEVVFIAGGNQWNYVNHWRGTQMLELLNELINEKQVTIGGTSAGMAVLGEVVYSAQNGTVWSSEALGDPYHVRLTLEKDFLDIPFMESTVTDSHYNRIQGDEMDRHGRHVAFMARMVTDWDMPARGVAANEYTAVAVDGEGVARVFGDPEFDDHAYFLKMYGGPPEVCDPGTPLTWDRDGKALRVYRIKGDNEGSGWFSLENWWEGEGGEWQHWHVTEGELEKSEADYTGIEGSQQAWPGVVLYPNPASGHLTITLGTQNQPFMQSAALTVTIRSATGKMLKQRVFGPSLQQEVTLDVEGWRPGLYLLEMCDGIRKTTRTWIKH